MMAENSKQSYAQSVIEAGLRKVGVNDGDVILLHADASPAMYLGDFEWWADALELLKQCFLNVLGASGTLIVPTFNYDFCRGQPYSHEETPSQVGMFTNHILRDQQAIRSFHPIFSFAAIGPAANDICDNVSRSSFGPGSVFEKLHLLNAKMVFFNVSFNVCTFIHYVEQKTEVDYRFMKIFKGNVSREDIADEDEFDFYVRYLDRDVEIDLTPLEKYLLSTNRMRKTVLADKYPILQVRCDDVYQAATERLKAEPYFLLKHPPRQIA